MNEEILQAIRDIRREINVLLKNVWSVADLAIVLNISESRVRHIVAEGTIPYYKPSGGKLYFKREEIEAWLLSNRTASNAEIESQAATYFATRRIR